MMKTRGETIAATYAANADETTFLSHLNDGRLTAKGKKRET